MVDDIVRLCNKSSNLITKMMIVSNIKKSHKRERSRIIRVFPITIILENTFNNNYQFFEFLWDIITQPCLNNLTVDGIEFKIIFACMLYLREKDEK